MRIPLAALAALATLSLAPALAEDISCPAGTSPRQVVDFPPVTMCAAVAHWQMSCPADQSLPCTWSVGPGSCTPAPTRTWCLTPEQQASLYIPGPK
jgi:hypothetical protein